MPQLIPFVDEMPIPPVVHPVAGPHGSHDLQIAAKVKWVKLHSDLPAPAQLWGYEHTVGKVVRHGRGDTYLGPTVEVRQATSVTVTWQNAIPAGTTLPYAVIKANSDPNTGFIAQNVPGYDGAIAEADDKVRQQARKLQAALVTHLHGGRTQADYDGWPDNTIIPGQVARYTYHNEQAAAMLWYHDHSMHVTRLNVYAGLAGVWLVRDPQEDNLHLPAGEYELPLVIQDRNLDVGEGGAFTGMLLHKVEVNGGVGPAEFFGPYTLVNGKIWPKTPVAACLYRLRLLNGSNARSYRLLFLDDKGQNHNGSVWQIGCDQGLLEQKIPLPETGLILMPAERADVLIDFSAYTGSIYLWNTADAPFGDDPTARPDAAQITQEVVNLIANPLVTAEAVDPANADRLRLFPQVMRFDIGAPPPKGASIPPDPLRSPLPPPDVSDKTTIRFMGLVEQPAENPSMPDATTMLVFWEFVSTAEKPAPPDAEVITIKYKHPVTGADLIQQYWKAASAFYDQVNWMVHLDSTEIWYIINLSGDAHPVHVHLVDFQVTQRHAYLWNFTDPSASSDNVFDPSASTLTHIEATDALPIAPDQSGPKDTVRVNPGEMIGITLRFSPYPGRYMYHCHILEHEDHDMMRPFVVVPKWVPHHDH